MLNNPTTRNVVTIEQLEQLAAHAPQPVTINLQDPVGILADRAARNDRAFGAKEFEGVLGGGIGDIEIVVNDAVGAVAEAGEDSRGILDPGGVFVNEQILEAGDLGDGCVHDPFQQVEAVRAHVQQCATVADGRVLAPGPGNGRVPAGELSAAHDQLAERTRLDQFAHLLVIDVLPHTPGEHELHPGFGARGFHLVHLSHCDGDGLFAQDMFAGLGGLDGLAAMDVGRRGDIDGLHILRQQLGLGRAGVRHAELRGHFFGALRVEVHHRHQFGIGDQLLEFRDGAPGGNAAAANHSPFDVIAHDVRNLTGCGGQGK